MKKIDGLVIKEIVGPWVFGAAIFTVLIMAGSFLFKLTEYLSNGADPVTTVKLALLLMPGIMAKTFSMATLLAALLAFGRLSGDSEIVALRAAGISLYRIMAPVAGFALATAVLAFFFTNNVVPSATLQAVTLRIEIEKALEEREARPTSHSWMSGKREAGFIHAKNFNIADSSLDDVIIVWYGEDGLPTVTLEAVRMVYENDQSWAMPEGGTLRSWDGRNVVHLQNAWPEGQERPDVTPEDLIAKQLRDLDAFGLEQMKEQIEREKKAPNPDESLIANLEFGYWNKISLPLAALVFGLIGAPLGIRSHRTGASAGFWMSVIIIFGYLILTNGLSIMAQGGSLPPAAASFGPILIGLAASGYLISKKSQ